MHSTLKIEEIATATEANLWSRHERNAHSAYDIYNEASQAIDYACAQTLCYRRVVWPREFVVASTEYCSYWINRDSVIFVNLWTKHLNIVRVAQKFKSISWHILNHFARRFTASHFSIVHRARTLKNTITFFQVIFIPIWQEKPKTTTNPADLFSRNRISATVNDCRLKTCAAHFLLWPKKKCISFWS